MPITTFFIDLDDTVYPAEAGIWDLIGARMDQYIYERLQKPWEEIPSFRTSLYQEYGTTMRGLVQHYQVDQLDFLKYVHNIPVEEILEPDYQLRNLLTQYRQRKIIFTNADVAHAFRVLRALRIDDCFDAIIDVLAVAPHCKPFPEAFELALQLAGNVQPEECAMFDDSPRNLSTARQLGMLTICVGKRPVKNCQYQIASLLDLPKIIPTG